MRAISTLSLEWGTSTFWWRALMALRTRVKKSATGSVKLMLCISSNRRPLAFVSGTRSRGPRLAPYAPARLVKEPAATYLPQPAVKFDRMPSNSSCVRARLQSCRPVTSPQRTFVREGAYHELFETPGISPLSASPRKHRRHRPNLRRNARGRPQILQRLCWRAENLGFLFAFAILDVLAIVSFTLFALRVSLFAIR